MSSSISISKALFSSVYGHSHLLSILPFLVTLKFELFWWFSFWVFVVSVRHSWCSCVDFVTYSFAEIVYQFCRSFRICTNETMLSGNRSKLISPFPFWLVFTTFSCLIVLPLILFTLKVKKLGLQKLITLPKLKKNPHDFRSLPGIWSTKSGGILPGWDRKGAIPGKAFWLVFYVSLIFF
jgi:hypothetical protein